MSKEPMASGTGGLSVALRGVRVVSLATNLPGPAALMRLRDMGATCIKVEPPPPPGSPPGTSSDQSAQVSPSLYADAHAGVQVLVLDLKSEEGQRRLNEELASAELLITSSRAKALAKLGLDWGSVHARHPDLSMVAIFGARGARADEPGHDLTYQCEAGLIRGLDMPASVFADMGGALLASEAALRLLLAKRIGGEAGYDEVALNEAARWFARPIGWGLLATGSPLAGAHAGYRLYACRDGRVAVAAYEPHFGAALCGLAGLEYGGHRAMMRQETHTALASYFAGQTCHDLEALARERDIPLHVMKP